MECDILIKNADWVITMDNLRRIIRNGSIAIGGNKISFNYFFGHILFFQFVRLPYFQPLRVLRNTVGKGTICKKKCTSGPSKTYKFRIALLMVLSRQDCLGVLLDITKYQRKTD